MAQDGTVRTDDQLLVALPTASDAVVRARRPPLREVEVSLGTPWTRQHRLVGDTRAAAAWNDPSRGEGP